MTSFTAQPISELFSVDGLVAVVTGGGTGIGLMIAAALEQNGATVYIVGRRLEMVEKAAREHNRHGKLIPAQCDVTSTESVDALIATVQEQHGYINLLVNNAGVALNHLPATGAPGPETGDIAAFQSALLGAGARADWGTTFGVNVTAAYYTTVQFLALLDAGNRRPHAPGVTSQVVTVASLAGFRRDEKNFTVSYAVSKAAAVHLGKLLANMLKGWQIRSNVIAPGIFPSEMSDGLVSEEAMKAAVPLGRQGDINDMGGLILYLASRAGAYINGSVQLIDGGRLSLFPSTY
ncbi:NAD(P)-binding protein [Phanerochaete sordida]|uniref:NAD(P)-binding protein n=1 Tax=Phanerochaete sordida TaxID=48140 RepID=A0A9P3LJL8_9APHY|nr:NAD(P)-binding protein [Phanerochaete sordida]